MTSRSRAGTTTWPLGEVLTIGMAILPWFNCIIICTTFIIELNDDTCQCNDDLVTDALTKASGRFPRKLRSRTTDGTVLGRTAP
jgi:hypothetical protein